MLDPDIDTYYLMDSLIIKLPTASENLAQVRSYGLLATERKSLTPEEKTRLTIVSGLVRSTFDAQFKNLQYMFNYNPPLRTELLDQLKANLSTVDTFLTSVNKDIISRASAVAFSPARLQVTSDDYFKNSTNTIDQSFKLLDVLTPVENRLLQLRIDNLLGGRNLAILFSVVALALTTYLFEGFYLAVKNMITRLDLTSKRMVSGQMNGNFVLDSRDELAQVATSFNSIATELLVARDQALEARRAKTAFPTKLHYKPRPPHHAT